MNELLLIGAGPGIGASVARLFASQAWNVSLIARHASNLEGLAAQMEVFSVDVNCLAADVTNEHQIRAAINQVITSRGVPDLVVYNAALIQPDTVQSLTAQQHLDAYAVNVVGAAISAGAILQAMSERKSGAFFITGGMPEPKPNYATLSLGKAGVRSLVSILDKQYRPFNIHVSSLTVDGPVKSKTAFDPDYIANEYWKIYAQPSSKWKTEHLFTGHPEHNNS